MTCSCCVGLYELDWAFRLRISEAQNLEVIWTSCSRCACSICPHLKTTTPVSLLPTDRSSTIQASTMDLVTVTATAKVRAPTVLATIITQCRYPPPRPPHPRPSVPLTPTVHLHHHLVLQTPLSPSKASSPVLDAHDRPLELRHLRQNQTPKRASRSAALVPVCSGCSNINIPETGASRARSVQCRPSRPPSSNRCLCFLCLRPSPLQPIVMACIMVNLGSESRRPTYRGKSYRIGRLLIGRLGPRRP